MRYWSTLALCALAWGCSKKEPAAPETPAEGAAVEAAAVEGATGAEAPAADEAGEAAAAQPAPQAPPAVGGTTPAVFAALSAEHTVAVSGFEGLDGLAAQVAKLMAELPEPLKADMQEELPKGFDSLVERMGFDPRDRAAWATVGLDPAAGVSLAVDLRLRLVNSAPLPVLLARVSDRGKLVAALERLDPAFDLALPETDGVARLTTPDGVALLGTRGDFTALMPIEDGVDADAARAAFAGWLKASDPPLSKAEGLAPALEMPGAARGFGVVLTRALLQVAPEPPPKVFADFYTARFPALSLSVGADLKSGRLRLQGDPAAVKALRQILISPHAAPALDRFAQTAGLVGGFSINPRELFDGVVALIPPERGDVQGQVLIGKNAVPVVLGVSLDDLGAALSGHGAVMATASGLMTPGDKPLVVALGVADEEVMDRILPVALDRLAAQGEGTREPTKFGAIEGHILKTGPRPTFVVRAGDALLFGPSRTAIDGAIAMGAKPDPARPRLSFADGAFYGLAVARGLFDALAADDRLGAGEELAAVRAFWDAHLGGSLSIALRVDDHGIVASGPAAALLLGTGAAVAIPAFTKYINRSKAAQARLQLGQLFVAASLARMEERPLSAAPLTPAADPCADGGDGSYEATAATWSHPTWKALGFAPIGEQYYRFAFEPGEGQGFTLRAVGDLDCDGVQAVYAHGTDAEGQRRPDVEENPLE